MAESCNVYTAFKNRFESLQTSGCSICFTNDRPVAACRVCGYVICDRCKLESSDCPICVIYVLSKKYNVAWDFDKTFPNPCRHCLQPQGFNDRHEEKCGFIPKECRVCRQQLYAKDMVSHVKQKHTQLLKKVPYHFDGKERKVVMNPKAGFRYKFARCLDNQLFWETMEHDVAKQLFRVFVVWIPNGDSHNVNFKASVRFELSKSIVGSASSTISLKNYGFYKQWVVQFDFKTQLLTSPSAQSKRNIVKVVLCIEKEPRVRLTI